MEERFNIRVYGLLIRNDQEILVSDEVIRGNYVTKFPGGGLIHGEGMHDCLVREFREELALEIEVGQHFYTTDFYQQSAFRSKDQIISVYYFVHTAIPDAIAVSKKPFDFEELEEDAQSCRWLQLVSLRAKDFALPIDKVVAQMLSRSILS